MIDSLKKIREAERQALTRMKAAEKESSAMLAKSEDEARLLVDRTCADARTAAADLIRKACVKAEAEAETIIREGADLSLSLKQSGRLRIEDAARIVVGRVTGET